MVTWTEGTAIDTFSLSRKCLDTLPVHFRNPVVEVVAAMLKSIAGRKKESKDRRPKTFQRTTNPAASIIVVVLCTVIVL
jgi:hypothetical protein